MADADDAEKVREARKIEASRYRETWILKKLQPARPKFHVSAAGSPGDHSTCFATSGNEEESKKGDTRGDATRQKKKTETT